MLSHRVPGAHLRVAALAVLAMTLLTGCDRILQGLEVIADITIMITALAVGVVSLALLGLLIMNAYRLASGRPSVGWGIAALVVGLVDLQALYIWNTIVKDLPQGQIPVTAINLPIGLTFVLLGGLNLFDARRRTTRAALQGKHKPSARAKPAAAEPEPPEAGEES